MGQMVDNAEDRIASMLTHGVSHLVGCYHGEDDDWELMAQKEEELLKLVKDYFKS